MDLGPPDHTVVIDPLLHITGTRAMVERHLTTIIRGLGDRQRTAVSVLLGPSNVSFSLSSWSSPSSVSLVLSSFAVLSVV